MQSIANQQVKDFETVIVIDGSKAVYDEVQKLVLSLDLPNPRIVYSDANIGASASRNYGARVAKGDVVGFVDDDVVLLNDWVGNVRRLTNQITGIDGLSGAAYPLWEDPRDSWLPISLYWVISCTGSFGNTFQEIRNMWTMNAVIRKDAFKSVGGFDEHLGPLKTREAGFRFLAEDLELTLRLRKRGYRIYFAPSIGCLHHVQHSQVSFRYIVRRSLWIGRERRILVNQGNLTGAESRIVSRFIKELIIGSSDSVNRNLMSRVKANLAIVLSAVSTIVGLAT